MITLALLYIVQISSFVCNDPPVRQARQESVQEDKQHEGIWRRTHLNLSPGALAAVRTHAVVLRALCGGLKAAASLGHMLAKM